MLKFYLILCLLLIIPSLRAAVISWEARSNVASASDISTNGMLVEAFNLTFSTGNHTNPAAADTTVNGVHFLGSISPAPLNNSNGGYVDYLSGSSTGDAAYDALLETAAYGGGSGQVTMTLGGGDLIHGGNYEIQVWYVEKRSAQSGRVMQYGDGNGNTVNLKGDDGSFGQYVVGSFMADGANQACTLNAVGFGNAHLTAYQIRKIGTQPVSTLSTISSSVSGAYTVTVDFTEAVEGLELSDFDIVNGNLSNLSGSDASYTILVTPIETGDITLLLTSDSVTDVDGDNQMNPSSDPLVTTSYLPSIPMAVIYGQLTTDVPEYEIYLSFSEEVSGLTDSDFSVINGTVSATSGNGRYYSATITADSPQAVEVTLPAGAVVDADGDLALNTESNTLSTVCTADFGEVWAVDDASSWTMATGTSSNMSIAGGFVEPTANSADFSSAIKTFPVKKKARSLVFRQSSVWDNWIQQNLNPGGTNAPVFIPVGNDDYYFLAASGNSYHAWHSTDMSNWTAQGAVTSGDEGRWVTSAEYKDGNFYIYSDYANDHTSHVFIDDDLSDGTAGTYIGPVLERNGSGSDLSVFRDNTDGLFHIIYEDWSPINANTHSWDSPLAGHTSSVDGINGFYENEHLPAVDHRTTPTGQFGSFNHPYVSFDPTYEIHSPSQDAYGDWTTIKVGARYYLFGDYDPHGESIILARFSSESIYEEFELVGSIDTGGHPDPTVGFAEGKFYLFTQFNDYYSPGPWVDGVEARAGVDVDGNGSIDEWTSWEAVSEGYDHTPNFIRVVTLTPAQIDLSGLSAGYGFQFEFRVDDTVVSGVSPIMDSIEMAFEPSNFQQWANGIVSPADPQADVNGNGIPNLFEFALGQSSLPQRQTDGTYTIPFASEALDDGYALSLWFSTDLSVWHLSTVDSDGAKLLNTTVTPSGDLNVSYELFAPTGNALFWKLQLTIDE